MDGLAALLPDGIPEVVAALLVIASFFTSALTASFGVGGGMAMLALLGVFLPVAALIPVHGAVQLGSNTGRAWHQRANVRMGIALPFVVGSIVGAFAGALVVIQLPDAPLKIVLGLFVLLITWARIPGVERLGHAGLAVGSAILALLGMVVGATGPLLSAMFAQIFAGDRKGLVATHAAAMTVQHGLKIVVFGLAGFAFAAWLPLIAAMVASGFLGTVYGTRLLERLPEAQFHRWFKVGMTLLAAQMVWQGVSAFA